MLVSRFIKSVNIKYSKECLVHIELYVNFRYYYSSQIAKEADREEKEKKHLSFPVVKEWMIFRTLLFVLINLWPVKYGIYSIIFVWFLDLWSENHPGD